MVRVELAGTWTLRRVADGSERPMTVPGDIASALLAAGEIPDPYRGRNELELQWIGREDWVMETRFEAPPELLERGSAFLDLDCVDTVAEVRLNGRSLAESSDMFRRVRLDVGPSLVPGTNTLSITIRSPEAEAARRAAALPYPVPASTYPVSSPHRNLVRKAQCMGGWDWGPCLMTGGVYDGAAVVGIDGPRVEYARVRSRRADRAGETARAGADATAAGPGDWIAEVTVELIALEAMEARIELSLAGAELSETVALPAGPSVVTRELLVRGPEAWRPNGVGPSGPRALYELIVGIGPASRESRAGLHELRKRVGFRDLRVEAEEDADGRSMTLVHEGRRLFAKGANWIPADALPSRWTRERYADLLASAAAAGMNCLRVWGGGRYEADAFYDLCDELGLLVWQDCMFSCALYPSSPDFLSEVEAETAHQVRRLADHPCIALWCGNNEALGAITWYEESKASPARYIVDYDRLTEGTVGRVVRALDPDRTWWPSSPSAGPNDFSDNWHADGRGDMHYWAVWHEGRPFSDYLSVRPRFCSEFGFQSFPSERCVASFADPDERNITSPAMEHHQRHPRGNSLIIDTMLRYYRMPKGFRETLYLSQVQQAAAIKAAVEYWRSNRPRCMGALYWQLNDVWPCASWSSLEYDGSWKLLHYEARRFFDPVLLALFEKDGVAYAYGVNDGPEPVPASLAITLRSLSGEPLAELGPGPVELAPESATWLWSLPAGELGRARDGAYLDARLSLGAPASDARTDSARTDSARVSGATGAQPEARRATLFLAPPKALRLVDPRLSAEPCREHGSGLPAIRIRAEGPAFYVTPWSPGLAGRWSDSGFYLGPGEDRTLSFDPAPGAEAPSPEALLGATAVLDLRGSYE